MNKVRDYIESITRKAARDANVDPDGDARRELASHLFDLANNHALGRSLTIDDVDAAWAELGPKAVYLLQEDSRPTTRNAPSGASWTRRLAAYLADVVAMILAAATFIVPANFIPIVLPERGIGFFVGATIAGLVFGLAAFEVRRGATPGKLLFRVRTVDENGRSPSWVRAWIIALPKVFPPLLMLDTVLGVLTGFRDRVRLTERLVKLRIIRVG